MKWAFVDYENIGNLKEVKLSKYERVIVFMGAGQTKLNFSDMQFNEPVNFTVIKAGVGGKNNLDFHIAYYLGKFDCEADKAVAFEVISNDADYDGLIAHIDSAGRTCLRVRVAQQREATNKRIVLKVTERPIAKRPQSLKALRNNINAVFSLKSSDKLITDHIKVLVESKVISLNGNKVEYLK